MDLLKSQREEILEMMELPEEIKKLERNEQNKAILDFITKFLSSSILENSNYIQDVLDYTYSQRQSVVLENFKNDLEQGSILDAYWELWDFIHNYGDTTYKKILSKEADEVIKDLKLICNKINNFKE